MEISDISSGFSITDDDHLILSGSSRNNGYDASREAGFIIKTDKSGNLLSKLKLLVGNSCEILAQKKLADGNILVSGWFSDGNNSSGFFLSKLDNNMSGATTALIQDGTNLQSGKKLVALLRQVSRGRYGLSRYPEI